MIFQPKLPRKAMEDCFRPPEEPCMVHCIHCGSVYSSDTIVWVEDGDDGFWRCPVEGCDGAGFQFDIFPVGMMDDDEGDYDEDDDFDPDED